MLNNQNEKIVKNLLGDNEMLNEKLNKALGILLEYKAKQNMSVKQPLKRLNNLQSVNVLLSHLVQLDGESTETSRAEMFKEINTISEMKKKQPRTLNELVAEEALEQFEWIKSANHIILPLGADFVPVKSSLSETDALDRLEILIRQIKQNRANKFSRLYQHESLGGFDLMLNVCKRCKGDIKTV